VNRNVSQRTDREHRPLDRRHRAARSPASSTTCRSIAGRLHEGDDLPPLVPRQRRPPGDDHRQIGRQCAGFCAASIDDGGFPRGNLTGSNPTAPIRGFARENKAIPHRRRRAAGSRRTARGYAGATAERISSSRRSTAPSTAAQTSPSPRTTAHRPRVSHRAAERLPHGKEKEPCVLERLGRRGQLGRPTRVERDDAPPTWQAFIRVPTTRR